MLTHFNVPTGKFGRNDKATLLLKFVALARSHKVTVEERQMILLHSNLDPNNPWRPQERDQDDLYLNSAYPGGYNPADFPDTVEEAPLVKVQKLSLSLGSVCPRYMASRRQDINGVPSKASSTTRPSHPSPRLYVRLHPQLYLSKFIFTNLLLPGGALFNLRFRNSARNSPQKLSLHFFPIQISSPSRGSSQMRGASG
jgi:hypothetical protein